MRPLIPCTIAMTLLCARGVAAQEPPVEQDAAPEPEPEPDLPEPEPDLPEPETDLPVPPPPVDTPPPTTPARGVTPPPPRTPPMDAGDEDTYPEPDPVLRLDGWLRLDDERAETGRIALAVLSLITGAASTGGAVWALSQDDDELRASIGGLFMLLGVFEITLGVAMLQITFPQEDRYARWNQVRARGATSEDIAGFAGELRMEAEVARFGRTMGAITGFAMAAGGAAALILSATVNSDSVGRIVTVTYGSAFLAIGGVVGMLSLLIETPIERDWNRYERGLAPRRDRDSFSFGVTPVLGDGVAGLAAHGTL